MGTKPVSILSLASRCNPSNRVPDFGCLLVSQCNEIYNVIYIYTRFLACCEISACSCDIELPERVLKE